VPEPLLRVSHLTKKYGDAVVVDDLSFAIAPGECLGVIGPNGAGKTTTIRICLGLTGADGGTVEAFGMAMPEHVREAKKRIGVVTQFDSLDPDFSCVENLRVYGSYFGCRARRSPSACRGCSTSPPCSRRRRRARASSRAG
jgi:lipooligosaccharide transport system ATP-binding protein